MFFPNVSLGFGSGGSGKATVTLTDNTVDAASLTTYTFSAQSIGAAASNRQIAVGIVAVGVTSGTTIDTVTVGGVSASVAVANVSADQHAELWIATVLTGTTGDVVVTFSAGKGGCGIGVHRVIGALSAAHATATSTADPMAASLAIPANGVAIGVGGDQSTSTYTWTNLTEGYDETVIGVTSQTGASLDNGTLQTPTITCDPSNAASTPAMALASWGPA